MELIEPEGRGGGGGGGGVGGLGRASERGWTAPGLSISRLVETEPRNVSLLLALCEEHISHEIETYIWTKILYSYSVVFFISH